MAKKKRKQKVVHLVEEKINVGWLIGASIITICINLLLMLFILAFTITTFAINPLFGYLVFFIMSYYLIYMNGLLDTWNEGEKYTKIVVHKIND